MIVGLEMVEITKPTLILVFVLWIVTQVRTIAAKVLKFLPFSFMQMIKNEGTKARNMAEAVLLHV